MMKEPIHEVEQVEDPIARNVGAIAAVHARSPREASHHQQFIEFMTHRLGSPSGLWTIVAAFVAWMALNLLMPNLGLQALDPPPFVRLQGAATLMALPVSIMVLATQNRQGRLAERRAELDLQINLLAEQKVAKVIALLEELRRDLPAVPNRVDPEAQAMKRSADPHAVAVALDEALERKPEER